MAIIVDYASLKTAVADYLARSDLTSFIPNFIQAAENRIYRELRVRQMINGHTVNTVAGDSSVLIDDLSVITIAQFLEIAAMAVEGGGTTTFAERANKQVMTREYPPPASGRPKLFRTASQTILLAPIPDSVYTLHVDVYERAPAMTENDDDPWIVTDAPEMVLYAALVEAEPFIKNDPRIATWEQKYTQARDSLQAADRREQMGGSKPRARAR